MILAWTAQGWEDYESWALGERADKRVLRRSHELVRETRRDPEGGMGKPEMLKGPLAGYASRRITDEHRLVYRVDGDRIVVIQCRGHY